MKKSFIRPIAAASLMPASVPGVGQSPSTGSAQAYLSQPLEFVAHSAPGGGGDQFVGFLSHIGLLKK